MQGPLASPTPRKLQNGNGVALATAWQWLEPCLGNGRLAWMTRGNGMVIAKFMFAWLVAMAWRWYGAVLFNGLRSMLLLFVFVCSCSYVARTRDWSRFFSVLNSPSIFALAGSFLPTFARFAVAYFLGCSMCSSTAASYLNQTAPKTTNTTHCCFCSLSLCSGHIFPHFCSFLSADAQPHFS